MDLQEPPRLVDGHIPLGRHTCTPAQAKITYVQTSDKNRMQLWQQWETLTEALRIALGPIEACWLSGSFFTNKTTPSDPVHQMFKPFGISAPPARTSLRCRLALLRPVAAQICALR